MKKFLIRSGITILFLFVVAWMSDRCITNNLHKSKARLFASWNDIFYGNMQCDAVIMGSSRAWVQYSPVILDSVLDINSYNLGVDGRAIDAEIVKYNTYRLYNPKPKLILQNVDFGNLGISNGYEREQFLPYLFCDSLYRMTKESEGFSIADKFLPLVRYAGYFQVIKEGLLLPNKLNKFDLYKGYHAGEGNWNGNVFATVDCVGFNHGQKAISMFVNYLQRCNKEDVLVVFVFAPVYIGVTEKMDDPQQMFDLYDSIASIYHCPVLNYTYSYLSYDTAYFYNATHLNKEGSELFSLQLANDLDSLRRVGKLDF